MIEIQDQYRAEGSQNEELAREFGALYQETQETAVPERNQSMRATIEEIRRRSPDARIFVVAGVGHFTEDPELLRFLAKEPYPTLALQIDVDPEVATARARAYYGSPSSS